jgi:hypothetical protein
VEKLRGAVRNEAFVSKIDFQGQNLKLLSEAGQREAVLEK